MRRLDTSSDLMSLHIGDRLLEVNGMPVKDQPLEKIENLLRSPESTLQVLEFIIRIHFRNF
jgi:LIM domain kinase 1